MRWPVRSNTTPSGDGIQDRGGCSMIVKEGRTPSIMPFDMTGIIRTDDGVLRYTNLASSLLEMFRQSVERTPDRECIVIVGGQRVTYQEVWDRSARVAGGLAA